ncbi:MAG: ferrous iron transport protein B [Thermodesulfobacteriota bacterium]
MTERRIRIALSGNPNAGKTTAFNAITGARQHIANYPGVTVEKKVGHVRHRGREIEVVDLPGTYSLTAYSLEEIVARDYLVNEKPDVVVDIVDASNLDRNLYLALQFRELGVPLIIALNMVDVADTRGISIDVNALSDLFQAPVVPTVARSKKGIDALLDQVVELADKSPAWEPLLISYGNDIDRSLDELEEVIRRGGIHSDTYSPRWLALKCLEGDDQIIRIISKNQVLSSEVTSICNRVAKHTLDTLEEEPEGIIADHRYGYVTGITRKVVKRRIESRLNLSDRIDRVLTNRFIGPIAMIGILYAIYEFTFWGSEAPVGWLEAFFDWLKTGVSAALTEGPLHSLIVSGIIDGVGGVLGFVPLILFLFFAISIMEDSGYLARVAYMLDRVLRWFGLHGNSVIALLVSGGISGGCAVPGVLSTRTLKDPKERIATLLVLPFMNCGAKLPLFGLLIAAFFEQGQARMLFLFTLISWFFALFAAKLLRATVLRGPKTPFVMELPPYRAPTLKGLLIHTWERTWEYVKKAGTVILGISIILWAMMTYPGLPDERLKHFETQEDRIKTTFLSHSEVGRLVPDLERLEEIDRLAAHLRGSEAAEKERVLSEIEDRDLAEAARRIFLSPSPQGEAGRDSIRNAYALYLYKMHDLERTRNREKFLSTVAGSIGHAIEPVTAPLGFDYKVNIALVGGFAAKEVIVSTLGTAYSLGDVQASEQGSLSGRLRNDPDWNPLRAFALVLFTMLYVPCFVTLICIRRESSWKWAGFSLGFNLVIAYLVTLIVYQTGLALGIGV